MTLANRFTDNGSHPTRYPFILGGEQQCGLLVLLKDKSARHVRDLNPEPSDKESSVQSIRIDENIPFLFYMHLIFFYSDFHSLFRQYVVP